MDSSRFSDIHISLNAEDFLEKLLLAWESEPPGSRTPFRVPTPGNRVMTVEHPRLPGGRSGTGHTFIQELQDAGLIEVNMGRFGGGPPQGGLIITSKGRDYVHARRSHAAAPSSPADQDTPDRDGNRQYSVFCAYSHRDADLLTELRAHLSTLRRQGKITLWYDREIRAGTDWEQEIDSHLNSAGIILLLVSAWFIDSDYCYGREMATALERDAAGTARVIPIIVRSSDWQDTPLGRLQALPTDGKAVVTWKDRDDAWTDVAKGIRRVIDELDRQGGVSGSRPEATAAPRAERVVPIPIFERQSDTRVLQPADILERFDRERWGSPGDPRSFSYETVLGIVAVPEPQDDPLIDVLQFSDSMFRDQLIRLAAGGSPALFRTDRATEPQLRQESLALVQRDSKTQRFGHGIEVFTDGTLLYTGMVDRRSRQSGIDLGGMFVIDVRAVQRAIEAFLAFARDLYAALSYDSGGIYIGASLTGVQNRFLGVLPDREVNRMPTPQNNLDDPLHFPRAPKHVSLADLQDSAAQAEMLAKHAIHLFSAAGAYYTP